MVQNRGRRDGRDDAAIAVGIGTFGYSSMFDFSPSHREGDEFSPYQLL